MRTITAAAVKVADRIFSGPWLHATCWQDAKEASALPLTGDGFVDWGKVWIDLEGEEGFLTDGGEFLNREEAMELALSNGQTALDYIGRTGELHAPDLF